MWFTYFHFIYNAIHISIPYIWGTQIFQNSRSHLKILDTRKGREEASFTGGGGHQILCAILQNLIPTANGPPGFVTTSIK